MRGRTIIQAAKEGDFGFVRQNFTDYQVYVDLVSRGCPKNGVCILGCRHIDRIAHDVRTVDMCRFGYLLSDVGILHRSKLYEAADMAMIYTPKHAIYFLGDKGLWTIEYFHDNDSGDLYVK